MLITSACEPYHCFYIISYKIHHFPNYHVVPKKIELTLKTIKLSKPINTTMFNT